MANEKAFPEFRYREVALGDVQKRNQIILADDLRAHMPEHRRECYATIARFPEAYAEYYQANGTVKGYAGACFVDTLWIDVDDADLNQSHSTALNVIAVLHQLNGVPLEDIKLYFTGKKGFHIGVPTRTFGGKPSALLPPCLKALARRLGEQANAVVDLSIYNTNSLLRLPNTINAKSGLWKIPLSHEEMVSGMEVILELAKGPRPSQPAGAGEPNKLLNSVFARVVEAVVQEQKAAKSGTRLTVLHPTGGKAECPKYDKVCMWRMMAGVPNGQRNETLLRIAVHLRQKGMPYTMAIEALTAWNRSNESELDQVEVENTARSGYENGYEFGCQDVLLDKYCSDACYLYEAKTGGRKDLSSNIYTVRELCEKYRGYVMDRDKAKVSWGFKWLDDRTRGLAPGQVGIIMARAGVGKTAWVTQTIGVNSEAGIPALFCSLEQLAPEIFERMASNASEMVGLDIENAFYDGDTARMEHVVAMVSERFKNAWVCDADRLTVKELKAYVKACEEKAGTKIRLLVVDYLGRMKGEGKDQYQRVSELAIGLKEVAKACELAIICLVQVNRSGGKGSAEVTMDMARDSGQVEEAADCMVGMWRANPEDQGQGHQVAVPGPDGKLHHVVDAADHYPVIVQINKNRKGPCGENVRTGVIFRPSVMRFEDVTWRPDAPPVNDGLYTPDPFNNG